jgi:4-alpha-glucanotransferase
VTGRSARSGTPVETSAELAELAAAYGVATEFWDWQGNHVAVPATSVRAILAALGVEASGPESVRASLAESRVAPWRRMLPACVVARAGAATRFRVHVPHGEPVETWVELENGGERRDVAQQRVWVDPREVDGQLIGAATFALPADLPLGWHTVRAQTPTQEASTVLAVTPSRLKLPDSLQDHRQWGFLTQLYAVRSRRSWSLGDLADLADLAGWSGRALGAGFVQVNPLHAVAPVTPIEPSPYLPTSRRFLNPLYLRVEEVVEYGYLAGAARAEVERLASLLRPANESPGELDRDAAWEAKRAALALVHRVSLSPGRRAAYDAFLAREGQGLLDFATWCVLAEKHGPVWHDWPAELHDPRAGAVAAARAQQADDVDFYCWLQWQLDEQLATAQRVAREAGMSLGVVHDLAVGVQLGGADTWAMQDIHASGVTVGAPPDAFNQLGQDWSQPPLRPDRLAETGYGPYRDMLRTILRHAGGVRVDHVLGLFRLWWVPEGAGPSAGTYVRYDHEALVGILALEAQRAGAVVVGEDLGTVEPWVRDYLDERGLLGTSVLWFERDYAAGVPLRPEAWRELCLATVTTHDLPPTAGYLAGEHIRLRESLGLLTRPMAEEQEVDAAERREWLDLLAELGLLPPGAGERETVEALHRYLARTPARLLGVSLPDAVGERRATNQPGTNDEYPNWRLPLADGSGKAVLLEDLTASERARSLAGTVGA